LLHVLKRLFAPLALFVSAASPGEAQVPHSYRPPSAETRALAENSALSAERFDTGVRALRAGNYLVAETVFRDFLREQPRHPDGVYLMGLTQMGLQKWPEARTFLEKAVRLAPKDPAPRSRLAVACLKLKDKTCALDQREAIERLSERCDGTCRTRSDIDAALELVDRELFLTR